MTLMVFSGSGRPKSDTATRAVESHGVSDLEGLITAVDNYLRGSGHGRQATRAFCPTGEGGGIDNSCSAEPKMAPDKDSGGGSSKPSRWGGETETWGRSSETEIWTPDRPLFAGAEGVASIKIFRPNEIKDRLADDMKMTIADAVLASGAIISSPDRASITQPRLEVMSDMGGRGILLNWTSQGVATGKGFRGGDSEFADKAGTVVRAVEASRDLRKTASGTVLHMGGFFIHPDFQGQGIALEAVSRSVSSPVSRLEMSAERHDHPDPKVRLSGYRAWPKYGYDAPIRDVLRVMRAQDLPDEFSGAKTLLELYSMPGGADWWAQNGDSIPLVFDTRSRSRSREVLLQYQDRARRGRRSIDMSSPVGIGSDSDQDDILEEVWEDIRKKGLSGQSPSQDDWDKWEKERTDGDSGKVQPH